MHWNSFIRSWLSFRIVTTEGHRYILMYALYSELFTSLNLPSVYSLMKGIAHFFEDKLLIWKDMKCWIKLCSTPCISRRGIKKNLHALKMSLKEISKEKFLTGLNNGHQNNCIRLKWVLWSIIGLWLYKICFVC